MAENKFKYNGKEEQRKEFSDGSGLEAYDFGWRIFDCQIGRFHSVDPMAVDFVSITPYNFVFNNPINFIDPNGATGEPVINEKDKTITIKSTLWFYGGAANQTRADAIASSIQKQWNDANGKTDGGDGYKVVFEVVGMIASEENIDFMKSGKSDYKLSSKDNFVRLEEFGSNKWAGNSGFLNWNRFQEDNTSAGHEYGHGLGWYDESQAKDDNSLGRHDLAGNDINGMRVPGIMTPSINMFYSNMEESNPKFIGPQAMPDPSFFKKGNNILDPDKRKVYQRDIQIIMKGFNPSSTKSIGNSVPYLFNSAGKIK